jgi:dihydrolipoamide dehydrogenase
MPDATGSHDLIVIGAGPGGYVAALRGARRGLRTALVEREAVGGICLNWGCIPTKAILRSAHLLQEMRDARSFGLRAEGVDFDYAAVVRRSRQIVDRLVKGVQLALDQAGVERVTGHGRLLGLRGGRFAVEVAGPDGGRLSLAAPKVILATGARARGLPAVPFDGTRVLSSREALALTEVPRRVLVIGAGVIGVEFADLFQAFDAEVTVVEMLPRFLPAADPESAAELQIAYAKRRIRILTGTIVQRVEQIGAGLRCHLAAGLAGSPARAAPGVADRPPRMAPAPAAIDVDCVLVAVGLRGNLEEIGLESVGLGATSDFLAVDGTLQTAVPGLYAIGDLIGPPLLAHAASAEGIHAADHAAGITQAPIDYDWVPSVVYTTPLLAWLGLDQVQARERYGDAIVLGRYPLVGLGRAVADGATRGFVNVILEREHGRLLGAQIVGRGADELIAELGVIGRSGVSAPDVMQVIHAHPTFSEAIPEAFAIALGEGPHA